MLDPQNIFLSIGHQRHRTCKLESSFQGVTANTVIPLSVNSEHITLKCPKKAQLSSSCLVVHPFWSPGANDVIVEPSRNAKWPVGRRRSLVPCSRLAVRDGGSCSLRSKMVPYVPKIQLNSI